MTDLEKAARLALEALERCVATCFDRYAHEQVMSRPEHFVNQAITALRQALERPQDEWLTGCPECGMDGECGCDKKSEPAQHDYRTKYDRPCYKCRNHFCPGNCKEPEHLQQPAQQQEPFAYAYNGIKNNGEHHGPHLVWKPAYMDAMSASMGAVAMPLYTHPQRKPWMGLTDEQIVQLSLEWPPETNDWASHIDFARAIEDKLKEKNAGGQA